ncbi:MAG: sugar kinase [Candidatus Omnitrophica bacterium]|nr:sugar kinase [Candidatus Omnitrophota bacterium]MBU4478043.1 sugar kinase [Candidatus Omnitrophota bacterium]MCG2704326.1 PfkB family carbohydrate kinase [Candidatus Omnitrophota bacterium]
MSIVVMGTVALDSVKTPHGLKKDLLGGSATHFSMSAGMFTTVHLAAVVGEDFPQKHMDFLKRKKIVLTSLYREKGCTFRWEGEYKHNDLNTACTLNTELGVITRCVPRLDESQQHIKNVFLANYDPDIQDRFLKSMRNAQFVGMDTMNLWIKTKRASLKRLLKKVQVFILNDAEARDLTQELNLLKAAKCLCSYGPRMVIIKKGEHGGIFYSRRLIFALPAYPLEVVVDPTGAGDTFAGGVMGYLAKAPRINDKSLIQALAYGTILSSFNVEAFGLSRTAALTKSQIEQRMRTFRRFFQF